MQTKSNRPNEPTVAALAFESAAFIPAEARITELAKLALEVGVSADDVRAYLTCRYSVRSASVETVERFARNESARRDWVRRESTRGNRALFG